MEIIVSGNDLYPRMRQDIFWDKASILSLQQLETIVLWTSKYIFSENAFEPLGSIVGLYGKARNRHKIVSSLHGIEDWRIDDLYR